MIGNQIAVQPQGRVHYEIRMYYQTTSNAHGEVFQNLILRVACLQLDEQNVMLEKDAIALMFGTYSARQVRIEARARCPLHFRIRKYHKSTSRVQVEVLQNLIVQCRVGA